MTKLYILDTNVLLHDPRSLFAFEDNEVVIPLVVLDELDKKKVGNDETARHARMVIRYLDTMRAQGNLHEGVLTDSGGTIRVELEHTDSCPNGLDNKRIDNRLIGVTLGLQQKSPNKNITLITKDINLRVKCDALGIAVEDYNADMVADNPGDIYMGHTDRVVKSTEIDEFYKNGQIVIENMDKLHYNEYVFMTSEINEKHSALARFDGKVLRKINSINTIWGISPKNKEQSYLLDALFDPNIKLVTVTGLAGTGKTIVSLAAALSLLLDLKMYKKILLSKPTQPVDKHGLGFLPGTLKEKMDPWMLPFWDNLSMLLNDKGKYYLETLIDDIIEICPITYARGRSLSDCIIILDECQQLTKHEVKTMISRIGYSSKIVLIGDIEQIDTPYLGSTDNGLSIAIETFKNEPTTSHITLTRGERSDIATMASKLL